MQTEQLEQKLNAIPTGALQPGGTLHFTTNDVQTNPSGVLTKVCGIYLAILRPLMQVSKIIPFLGSKLRGEIADTEALLDQLCPGE